MRGGKGVGIKVPSVMCQAVAVKRCDAAMGNIERVRRGEASSEKNGPSRQGRMGMEELPRLRPIFVLP